LTCATAARRGPSSWIGSRSLRLARRPRRRGAAHQAPARGAPGAARSARAPRAKRHFHYDPAVAQLPDDTCLEGYWQSERYFADAADLVRRQFRLRSEPSGRNAELVRQIASCTAVSVHVRRGDYATDPTTNAAHGLCPLDYYRRAAAYVAQRVPRAGVLPVQ
jgi:hypothetical protein